jgi:uncharacterized protein YkwD
MDLEKRREHKIMKARSAILSTIFAAILATGLLAPVSAETEVEVTFSNGNVYLVEAEVAPTEKVEVRSVESVNALATEVLRLTNIERTEQGLAPLTRHQALESAAESHSQEMRTLNYFSHHSPTAGKSTARQRVNQFGVNPQMVAENIFECSGYEVELTARLAVEAFLQSPGHRQNLLNPSATHIGIGLVETNGTVSVTQVFAAGI